MKIEIDTFCNIFSNSHKFNWEIAIRYLILSRYECAVLGYMSLKEGGIFYNKFKFLFFIAWPKDIKKRTIKAKIKHSELVSINFLEFVIVIIVNNIVLNAIEIFEYCNEIPYP